MMFKRFIRIIFLLLITGGVFAQTPADTKKPIPVQEEKGVRMTLPDGKLTNPVLLPKEEAQPSLLSRTMSYIGSNLKESFENTLESFLPFQFKYAIMLNESVENLTNIPLYKTIDEWYGTRYRYGGTSHKGIDCSAFMQVLSEYAFGWMLPRTARAQYASLKKVTMEDLREGDLVFFNTTGGVSHVGMYLQNGRFVHSSSSQGVGISSLEEAYWKARFIGARRATDPKESSLPVQGVN